MSLIVGRYLIICLDKGYRCHQVHCVEQRDGQCSTRGNHRVIDGAKWSGAASHAKCQTLQSTTQHGVEDITQWHTSQSVRQSIAIDGTDGINLCDC